MTTSLNTKSETSPTYGVELKHKITLEEEGKGLTE